MPEMGGEAAPKRDGDGQEIDFGSFSPGGKADMPFRTQTKSTALPWLWIALSVLALAAGLTAAFLYKRKAHRTRSS